ncbi:MAG: dihydropteroate synthase [Desulfovibrionaceae bacterium]
MRDVQWTVRGGRVLGPAPFFIAGIVNVTPDSFYDGGRHADTASAVAHGLELARQGADLLDVGGESTRPYADPVPEAEEIRRVAPVLRGLAQALGPDGPVLCVDTVKPGAARAALEAGAAVVNDVSALADPALLDLLAEFRPGYVLMHTQGTPADMQDAPRYADPVAEVLAFFERGLARLTAAGLPEDRVVLDPGIGFGKRLEHNLALLRGVERFMALGRPVYVGLSNKSLFAGLLDLGPDERHNATQAATAVLAMRGVAVHRVHEVEPTRQTLAVVRALSGEP